MVSYKRNVWYNLSCLLQTYCCLSIIEKLRYLTVFWDLWCVINYGSGWRKDVVNQWLEFGQQQEDQHLLDSLTRKDPGLAAEFLRFACWARGVSSTTSMSLSLSSSSSLTTGTSGWNPGFFSVSPVPVWLLEGLEEVTLHCTPSTTRSLKEVTLHCILSTTWSPEEVTLHCTLSTTKSLEEVTVHCTVHDKKSGRSHTTLHTVNNKKSGKSHTILHTVKDKNSGKKSQYTVQSMTRSLEEVTLHCTLSTTRSPEEVTLHCTLSKTKSLEEVTHSVAHCPTNEQRIEVFTFSNYGTLQPEQNH